MLLQQQASYFFYKSSYLLTNPSGFSKPVLKRNTHFQKYKISSIHVNLRAPGCFVKFCCVYFNVIKDTKVVGD